MVTDTIADLIIRIKNAGAVKRNQVEAPYSRTGNSIAQKLRVTKYLDTVETVGHGSGKRLVMHLAYDGDGRHKIREVKRISKPSRRVYMGVRDIRKVKNGLGKMILSTPKGILTGEEARKEHVGGEALFLIW